MLSIHCKIALFFLFPSLACPPFWKFRNGEHAHYVGLVVAYTWNREKQMFVALGKEFDMVLGWKLNRIESIGTYSLRKSLEVMHHFKAVWMISLCHMLIQKKIINIKSVPEILHISDIQCQLILMKHLSSFFRMTILIYSILHLGYCISSPLWIYSTSVISSCTIWL